MNSSSPTSLSPYSLLAEKALLSLKVCDPAVGSGHFLVGAAHRLARHLARVRALVQGESEPSPLLYQHALRDVIGRCLYGVDINPMAAELCRVSLWLEALEPGKPLSFLDHHIRVGNSLLGTTPELLAQGIPDDAFKPIEGDDKDICRKFKKQNKEERGEGLIRGQGSLFDAAGQPWQRLGDLATGLLGLEDISDDTIEGVRQKQERYAELVRSTGYLYGRLWADAWCAAFVWKKTKEFPYPITEEVFRRIERNPFSVAPWLRDEIQRLARQYQFFHWHLEFPDVFAPSLQGIGKSEIGNREVANRGEQTQGPLSPYSLSPYSLPPTPSGGFDIILGNPPWERVKLQEKEWFAERSPEIANAPNAAARKRMIDALKASDPALYQQFLDDSRKAEGESYLLRNSGRYPLCGRGDINLYAVFAEGMRNLLNEQGRVGCVLPTGIATDDTTKFFFQDVIETKSLASLFDFENRLGLFPEVDSRMKFCLFTAGRGLRPVIDSVEFVFFAHAVEDLRDADRRFTLSAEDIALLNPNTRTCPIFRSRRDAELTKAIYRRVPVLSPNETESAIAGIYEEWNVTLFTMLHSSAAAHLFIDASKLEAVARCESNTWVTNESRFLPLYEGKMFHQFDHRFADVVMTGNVARPAQPIEATEADHQSPTWVPTPRAWVDENELDGNCPDSICKTWFLGFKDVASSTNERTLLAAILPRSGIVDSVNIIGLSSDVAGIRSTLLLTSLNAFVLDFVARQKVGGLHIKFYVLNQLPVLAPSTLVQSCPWSDRDATVWDWLLPRVLELIYTAWDLEPFACDCVAGLASREIGSREIGSRKEGLKAYVDQFVPVGADPTSLPPYSLPPFKWDEERRFLLRCELDAAFFHLYLGGNSEWTKIGSREIGSREEAVDKSSPNSLLATSLTPLLSAFPTPRHAVAYIMDTFPIVRRKDEEKYNGDYRTKRVILEIYDAMQRAIDTREPYHTCLAPSPSDPRVAHPSRQIAMEELRRE